ncbi:MAG: hypothetical protein ACPG7E_09405, partial [Marinirhabdus sp.]
MKTFYATLALLFFTVTLVSQNNTISAIDKLLIDYKKGETQDSTYSNALENFKKQEMAENKITGKIGFGLKLSNSRKNDLTEFNVSAEVKKGFFPGQFE